MKNGFKFLIILALPCLLFIVSCKKEAALTPFDVGSDPFIRKDNPASAVDHAIYQFYEQTHLPVLYSDTVSRNPLFTIDLNYHLSGFNSTLIVDYLRNDADILTGLQFVQSQFLPLLSDSLKPYSVLLIDSLISPMYGYYDTTYTFLPAYAGLNTFAIANVPHIAQMTPDSLKRYKAAVFSALLLAPLNKNGILEKFYSVSADYYGKYVYGDVASAYYLPYLPKEEYGLIPYGNESTTYYSIGSQSDDLSQYLNTILSGSEASFTQRFGAYPLVMQKYNYLITALSAVGFKIDKL
ncbi:hypothetical protein A9P82_02045 [Arachidicoccus ginsenosidimutans]|uniref:hypothetical protein n=1 Tax=Arachidicoccus sp. BS20 TaxID=1850526 RepID=UPI0007F06455|nr:hypothetical protein [Arachidicoccus sp. BS20]ANI88196.1 hypothetical protein A9P82_02045 [Arachidicoccus sp. BS20]